MNPEAIKHRDEVREARAAYNAGKISQAELYEVVDRYIDWMTDRQKKLFPKRKVRKFSRGYILRAL